LSWGGHSMITPNGRFATNERICMSMSDCTYLTFTYRFYVLLFLLLFYIQCYQILDNLSGCTLCIGFIWLGLWDLTQTLIEMAIGL
jgi:hypothetical protein